MQDKVSKIEANHNSSEDLSFINAFCDPVLLISKSDETYTVNDAFLTYFNLSKKDNIDVNSYIATYSSKNSTIQIAQNDYDLFVFESELRYFGKFYSSVFNNSKNAIFFLKDNQFYHCNNHCLELFECKREDIIGKTPYDFSPMIQPGGVSARHSEYLIAQARLGNHQRFKWQHLSKKGRLFWLEVDLMPVDIEGEVFVQALTTDITDLIDKKDMLKEHIQFSETVLNSMGEALITTDNFGKIVSMNPVAEKLTGWKFELAKSQHINSVSIISDLVSMKQASFKVEEVIQKGRTVAPNATYLLSAKNGRKYSIQYNASPLIDAKGKIWGAIVVFANKEIDKEVQKALKSEHKKFNNLYKSLPESIAIYEIIRGADNRIEDYLIKDANDAYFESLKLRVGLNPKDLIGKRISQLYPDHKKAYEPHVIKALQSGEPVMLSDAITLTGKTKYVNLRFIPLSENTICVVVEDVSELKKYSTMLKHQENKINTIYNTAHNIAFVINEIRHPYKILEISPGGLEMLRLNQMEYNVSIFDFHLPENKYRVIEATDELILKKVVSNIETQLVRKDGEVFDALISLQTITLDSGEEVALGVVTDITEQKKAQRTLEELNQNLENIINERTMELKATLEELESSNIELTELNTSIALETQKLIKLNDKLSVSEQELQYANATKNRFFSIIGHDLKNPVHALILSIDILQMLHKQNDRSKTDQYLEHMKENTLRLRLTLENLLSWAQSQDGKLIAKKEEFLFSSIINDSIKIASEHVRRKNIRLTQELACNVTVSADKNMIETVVRNLLTNAIKFTNEYGQITIRTYAESDLLKCEISDTGIGMSKEELSMLFRLDSHNIKKGTNKETGSGLGLILCKEFIEKNGGTISVSSELGKGSTFSISLPIAGV